MKRLTGLFDNAGMLSIFKQELLVAWDPMPGIVRFKYFIGLGSVSILFGEFLYFYGFVA